MPSLFDYDVTPKVVPHSASLENLSRVTWMITVNNGTGRVVRCRQIVFAVASGEGREDLVIDPASIACAPARGTPWAIRSNGDGSFIAVPNPPAIGLVDRESIAFFLRDAKINLL